MRHARYAETELAEDPDGPVAFAAGLGGAELATAAPHAPTATAAVITPSKAPKLRSALWEME